MLLCRHLGGIVMVVTERCSAIQKFRHTGRETTPWRCPQPTVLGYNSSLYGTLAHTTEGVSPQSLHPRHLPIIPSFIPPYPSSPSQFPCPPSSPSLHNFLLCFGSKRWGCPSREQCCHGVRVKKKERKKENWGTVQGGSNKSSSVLLSSGVRRERDRKRGGQVDGCAQKCQVSFTVDQQAAPQVTGSLYFSPTAGCDYISLPGRK